jgi:glucose/arabinose dehydrogenase
LPFVGFRTARTLVALPLLLVLSGCGSATAPPSAAAPSSSVSVHGTEHFAWSQTADAVDIGQYTFTAYVDDLPSQLPDARCDIGSAPAQFDCNAKLPSMSAGAHSLQVSATFSVNGVLAEGPRSAALNLLVNPTTNATAPSSDSRLEMTASDGTVFAVETVARGLDAPSSLAATADGRIFIAERRGSVRVWKDGRVLDRPALELTDAAARDDDGLIGLALHPDFSNNGEVFVAYSADAGDGTFVERIVRYREVDNAFAQPAVILEDRTASPLARAPRIAFGPDAKLYVTYPANAPAAQVPASYVGKILRMNGDGTTPSDNPGYSPILADDSGVPAVFGWNPTTNERWQIDRDSTDDETLIVIHTGGERNTSAKLFSPSIDPSGAAFYTGRVLGGFTGDLFVSGLNGQQIQRVRIDHANPNRIVATEPLLYRTFGRIGDIVAAPNGVLFFCTANRVGGGPPTPDDDRLARIVPTRGRSVTPKVK